MSETIGPSLIIFEQKLLLRRQYLQELKETSDTAETYKRSCFTDQMFGSTHIASRVRIDDAHYDSTSQIPLVLEERNSVAIDCLSGAATGKALFNFQVCTSGAFKTNIRLKNFTLAQLGLIGLVLRDLDDGWFSIGFAKSRGLGIMKVKLHEAIVQYPTCQLKKANIETFNREQGPWPSTHILGAGEFVGKKECLWISYAGQTRQRWS